MPLDSGSGRADLPVRVVLMLWFRPALLKRVPLPGGCSSSCRTAGEGCRALALIFFGALILMGDGISEATTAQPQAFALFFLGYCRSRQHRFLVCLALSSSGVVQCPILPAAVLQFL